MLLNKIPEINNTLTNSYRRNGSQKWRRKKKEKEQARSQICVPGGNIFKGSIEQLQKEYQTQHIIFDLLPF